MSSKYKVINTREALWSTIKTGIDGLVQYCSNSSASTLKAEIDGLVQDCSNSSASTLKAEIDGLLQDCSNSSASTLKAEIDDLVQDCSNSIANALELLQSCTKPSKWYKVCVSHTTHAITPLYMLRGMCNTAYDFTYDDPYWPICTLRCISRWIYGLYRPNDQGRYLSMSAHQSSEPGCGLETVTLPFTLCQELTYIVCECISHHCLWSCIL